MHDYPTAVLAFAAAARLAVHNGDLAAANRQLTAAMRARPALTFLMPFSPVRARLHLAKAYLAIGEQNAARHLLSEIDDVLVRRPALGTLIDEVAAFRRFVTSSGQPGTARRVAAQRGGVAAAPVPADPPHHPRHRPAAVRVPQHRQLPGQLDLSKAGRHVARRGRATSDRHRAPRRVGRRHRANCGSISSVS